MGIKDKKESMKKLLTISALSLCSLLAYGQAPGVPMNIPGMGGEQAAADPFAFLPDVIATVDGVEIKKEAVMQTIGQLTAQFTRQGMSLNQLPPQYLNQFVQQAIGRQMEQIMLLKLAKADGIKPSPDLAQDAIKVFEKRIREERASVENLPAEQKAQIEEQIKTARGMTLDEMMNDQIKSMTAFVTEQSKNPDYQDLMAIQLWVNNNIINKVSVNDEDTQAFYDGNAQQFEHPETVTASHILITPEGADPRAGTEATPEAKAKAKEQIDTVLKLVKEGADFGQMAKEHSTGPSAPQEGSLGTFGRGQMVPAFEEAAFALKAGEVSDIVETQFGYHIIKVTEKGEAGVTPFVEVKDRIKAQLEGQKIDDAVQLAVSEAQKTSKVVMLYEPPVSAMPQGIPGM